MLQFLIMPASQSSDTSVVWDEQGLPHSTIYDDHYFCKNDGLNESVYTFCEGNDLTNRFKSLSSKSSGIFTIVETGFGTGLNFLCTWHLWQSLAPSTWTLRYISLDKHPLKKNELSKALELWPELKFFSNLLEQQYPQTYSCEHSLIFDNVCLRLFFDDVVDVLIQLNQENIVADAWFLDGFAPSKNPDMWSNEVFSCVKNSSQNGTTFATFTAAGHVRRGLEQNGFDVIKAKGFGSKRHMLKGIFT